MSRSPGYVGAVAALASVAVLPLIAVCDGGGMDALREAAARGTPMDRPLPELTLERLHGDSVRLEAALGPRLTVINFWGTWCKPCEEEMPHLVELHDAWSPHGVRVLGITVRSYDRDAIEEWVDRFGVEFPTLVGRSLNWVSERFGLSPGLPRTILVDSPSRRVRHVWTGARTREDLERGLRRYWRERWGRLPPNSSPRGPVHPARRRAGGRVRRLRGVGRPGGRPVRALRAEGAGLTDAGTAEPW